MNNNELLEYKESFKAKLKNLVNSKIEKNNHIVETPNLKDTKIISEEKERAFFDNVKVETSNIDKYMDKKNFLEHINGNVEALKMLSVDRLEKLKEYYDSVIENNDRKIAKLKKSS